MYPRDDVAREQKYTEQNQTEHRQVQHDEHVVHVSRGRRATNEKADSRTGRREARERAEGAQPRGGFVLDGSSFSVGASLPRGGLADGGARTAVGASRRTRSGRAGQSSVA